MPIDLEKAVGAELAGGTAVWSEEDIILYHLGVGAGVPPTDPGELRYAFEGDLRVLPTYATIPQFPVMMSVGYAPGFDINPAMILHGEHEIVIHEPIPTSGTVIQAGSVTEILDKGKGALAIVEVVSTLERTGKPLFTNRASVFIRGEGGFGGDSGPPNTDLTPSREPDHVVESVTLPQQALLYRMASGDKNPLHADPGFAVFAGFDRPILHGLCTYGIVCKTVVDHALEGRPEAVASFRARFSGVVYPGETLVTSIWEEGGRILVSTSVKERRVTVLSNGVIGCKS
jgi:acyl dehydratase